MTDTSMTLSCLPCVTEANVRANESDSAWPWTQHRQSDSETNAWSSLWRLQRHWNCLIPAVAGHRTFPFVVLHVTVVDVVAN